MTEALHYIKIQSSRGGTSFVGNPLRDKLYFSLSLIQYSSSNYFGDNIGQLLTLKVFSSSPANASLTIGIWTTSKLVKGYVASLRKSFKQIREELQKAGKGEVDSWRVTATSMAMATAVSGGEGDGDGGACL
ncbi:hypothetical protein BDN70DRAFT_115865 [Pholiota conissans]|uniref:Uncharacterized protein n=1 Tax=Pholiota conissans TaxID=109636 RepID=A0A9P6CZ58_9AGAR|nr:hypothetical protein BDN70DRAFT_115865 [Pholiota conissans]